MADPARGTAKELCELGRSRRTQKIFRGPSVAHRPRVGPYHTRLVGGPGTRRWRQKFTAFSGLYMNWKKVTWGLGLRLRDAAKGDRWR